MATTDDLTRMIAEIGQMQNEIKNHTERLNNLKAKVQDAMGESEFIVDCQGKPLVSWKSSKDRSSFDLKRFKAEKEDLYNEYVVKTKGSRSFLIKK